MLKTLIKPSAVLGAIIGVILGIILLIPIVQILAFIAFLLIGSGVVWYLKHYSFIGIISLKDGAIMGAVSGFIATLTASLICLPVIIIKLFFISPITRGASSNQGIDMIFSYIFILILLVLSSIAPIISLFNALSGMSAAFIYKKKEDQNLNLQTEFVIDDTI